MRHHDHLKLSHDCAGGSQPRVWSIQPLQASKLHLGGIRVFRGLGCRGVQVKGLGFRGEGSRGLGFRVEVGGIEGIYDMQGLNGAFQRVYCRDSQNASMIP